MTRKSLRLSPYVLLRGCISLCVTLGVCLVCQAAKPGSSDLVAAPGSRVTPRKFELDIQPILTARGCNAGACHGKARGQNGFALSLLGFDADTDYKAMVLESRGRRLSFINPSASLLLEKATGQIPHGGGVRFTKADQDYQLIVDWIKSGAARTSDADPKLVSIDVLPSEHSLAPEETESLKVTATYSDGSARDVTRMCAFQSNEPAIVAVGADGIVKAESLPAKQLSWLVIWGRSPRGVRRFRSRKLLRRTVTPNCREAISLTT